MFQPLFVRPLQPVEKEDLERCSNSSNREVRWRADVILLSAQGKTASEISQSLGFHPSNVKKWIRKFNKEGLGGIAVKKRGPVGGPRPKFTSEQVERILALSKTRPSSLGYLHKEWSPQKLARAAVERSIVDGISHVTVREILRRNNELAEETSFASAPGNGAAGSDGNGKPDNSFYRLGEAEFARSNYEGAVEYFQRALDQESYGLGEEAQTRSLLSRALEELSRHDEAYDAIEKYEDLKALASLHTSIRAQIKLRLGWADSWRRNYPKAIASLNEAKKLFLDLQDELGLSETHSALGRTYIEINEFRIARDHLLTAANTQRSNINSDLLAGIYNRLGTVDYYEGSFSNSKKNYLKALELAEGSTNKNLLGMILVNLGTSIYFLGGESEGYRDTREDSARYLKQAIEYLEPGVHKDFLAHAYNNLGDNLGASGLWEEAIESLKKAIDIVQSYPHPDYEATARITLAEILTARGSLEEAEGHIKRSLELIEGSADKWLESNALRMLAGTHRAAGRSDAALKTLRQALQLSTSIGDLHGVTLAQVGLAEFHFSQGGHDQAREYIELAQGRLKEEQSLLVSGLIQRLTGQLEAACGRLVEAKQHIAQSISIFTTTDTPYELARSHYEMGLLLKKMADLKGAGQSLLHAKQLFARLGAGPNLEMTEKALASNDAGEERGPEIVRDTPPSDVLLMQRLIEASVSPELLVRELAAVVCENFRVEHVMICRAQRAGGLEVLANQGITGTEAARQCRQIDASSTEPVSITAQGYCLRIGDSIKPPIFLCLGTSEPLDIGRLQPLLKQAELGLETCSLRVAARSAAIPTYEHRTQMIMPGFIVGSKPMFDVIDKIYKIRTSDVTVLITGQSGTGKELVARAIHAESARARAIFLPFNCTATPKEIIDSQLFGHRRGAFTGATANYPGIIKAADGGTLFLDEIGDLSLEVQPKLMRFLQESEIQPLGETKPLKVDVRIVAATNTELERAVEDGRFREDLFHRLNIIRIHVPPLKDRREEVPVLAQHFLEHFSSRSGKQGITLRQEAIDALMGYSWPGNVRQLRNEIERVVTYAVEGAQITTEDLSPEVAHPRRMSVERPQTYSERDYGFSAHEPPSNGNNGSRELKSGEITPPVKIKEATAALERRLIKEALERNKNNLSRTANDLGLSRRGLRLKIVQLKIQKEEQL